LYAYEIKIGNILITPSGIIALASGWILTETYGFDWPFWTTWGGIIAIVVIIVGGIFVQNLKKKLIKRFNNDGIQSNLWSKTYRKLKFLELISLILLTIAVWLMVSKYTI